MIIVKGKIKHGGSTQEYEVYLDVEDISQDAMPIDSSTSLIVNAINKKYGTNYPLNSLLNEVSYQKVKLGGEIKIEELVMRLEFLKEKLPGAKVLIDKKNIETIMIGSSENIINIVSK